jgi:hypothetical protein
VGRNALDSCFRRNDKKRNSNTKREAGMTKEIDGLDESNHYI